MCVRRSRKRRARSPRRGSRDGLTKVLCAACRGACTTPPGRSPGPTPQTYRPGYLTERLPLVRLASAGTAPPLLSRVSSASRAVPACPLPFVPCRVAAVLCGRCPFGRRAPVVPCAGGALCRWCLVQVYRVPCAGGSRRPRPGRSAPGNGNPRAGHSRCRVVSRRGALGYAPGPTVRPAPGLPLRARTVPSGSPTSLAGLLSLIFSRRPVAFPPGLPRCSPAHP